MCLIAAATIPRGGVITVTINDADGHTEILVHTKGSHLRLADHVPALIAGEPATDNVDAHGVQAFYTGLIARECAMDIKAQIASDFIEVSARSIAVSSAQAAE
jgi:histidine phosphotransferase ChpT